MGSSGAVVIGTEKQLFLDDSIIESQEGIRFAINPARKAGGPVISPGPDPEARISAYSSLMKENNGIRVWYDDRLSF